MDPSENCVLTIVKKLNIRRSDEIILPLVQVYKIGPVYRKINMVQKWYTLYHPLTIWTLKFHHFLSYTRHLWRVTSYRGGVPIVGTQLLSASSAD